MIRRRRTTFFATGLGQDFTPLCDNCMIRRAFKQVPVQARKKGRGRRERGVGKEKEKKNKNIFNLVISCIVG